MQAPPLTRGCCSPTAGCRGHQSCKFHPIGARARVIFVNLIPDIPLYDLLRTQRQAQGRRNLTTEPGAPPAGTAGGVSDRAPGTEQQSGRSIRRAV